MARFQLDGLMARGLALFTGVVVGLLVFAPPSPIEVENPSDPHVSAQSVIVAQAVSNPEGSFFSTPGTLYAQSETVVTAQVGGRVRQIYVKEGETVSVNQPLFQLDQGDADSESYEQLQQAQLSLASAQSNLSNIQSLYSSDRLQLELSIMEIEDALSYAKSGQSITESSQSSQLQVAQSQVENAKTQLEVAQLNQSNTIARTDQSIQTALDQSFLGGQSALEQADIVLEHVDEILGIDEDNVNPWLREEFNEQPYKFWLQQVDRLYLVARDLHEESYEWFQNHEASSVNDVMAEEALVLAETVLEATLDVLESMEDLLSMKKYSSPEIEAELIAYADLYDQDQALILGQISQMVNYRQAVSNAYLEADLRQKEAQSQVDVAQVAYESALSSFDQVVYQLDQQVLSSESSTTSLENQLALANQRLSLLGAQYEQQLDQARYAVSIQESALRQVRLQFEKGIVLSPAQGTLAQFGIEVGTQVSPGVSLGTVVDTDAFEVHFAVSEFELPSLALGDQVELVFDRFPGELLTARVEYISPLPDSLTRTYQVKASLDDDADISLASGLSVDVRVDHSSDSPSDSNSIWIPLESVLSRASGEVVFLVEGDRVILTPVVLGDFSGEFVEVLEGLDLEDVIVIQGQNVLNDGDLVQIVDSSNS